jgi:hypothetical protein
MSSYPTIAICCGTRTGPKDCLQNAEGEQVIGAEHRSRPTGQPQQACGGIATRGHVEMVDLHDRHRAVRQAGLRDRLVHPLKTVSALGQMGGTVDEGRLRVARVQQMRDRQRAAGHVIDRNGAPVRSWHHPIDQHGLDTLLDKPVEVAATDVRFGWE